VVFVLLLGAAVFGAAQASDAIERVPGMAGALDRARAAFGAVPVATGQVGLLALAMLAVMWPLIRFHSRRYNVCWLSTEGLRYAPSPSAWVPREDVMGWERTAHGLLVRDARRPPLGQWLLPWLLVPADDEEEVALAEGLLAGRDPPPERVGEPGPAEPPGDGAPDVGFRVAR